MAKSIPQPQIRRSLGKRFSLRTLFLISGVIAVPFLLLANLRNSVRPEESVASPLYLLLGITGVVFAAAIGSAVGSRAGMFTSASIAAFCWVALMLLCSLFSKELTAVLPVHVLGAVATLAVLAGIVWATRKPEAEGPHDQLLRLLKIKHDVREAQQARHPDSTPVDSPIQSPKPKT